jgi:hypothetical protein
VLAAKSTSGANGALRTGCLPNGTATTRSDTPRPGKLGSGSRPPHLLLDARTFNVFCRFFLNICRPNRATGIKEEPAPALSPSVRNHPDVTAGGVARLDSQCPCSTAPPAVRTLCRAHDTVVRPFVPLARPHGRTTLGCLSPVRATVVQLPELPRDVRPQLRSSLAEVGGGRHHPIGRNVGVYVDDNMRQALAIPCSRWMKTRSPAGSRVSLGRSPVQRFLKARHDALADAVGFRQRVSEEVRSLCRDARFDRGASLSALEQRDCDDFTTSTATTATPAGPACRPLALPSLASGRGRKMVWKFSQGGCAASNPVGATSKRPGH